MRSICRLSDHHKPMRPRPTMRSLLTSKIGEICANRQLWIEAHRGAAGLQEAPAGAEPH